MDLAPGEIDEMLRRADTLRLKLRRVTRELEACGQAILRAREAAKHDPRSR